MGVMAICAYGFCILMSLAFQQGILIMTVKAEFPGGRNKEKRISRLVRLVANPAASSSNRSVYPSLVYVDCVAFETKLLRRQQEIICEFFMARIAGFRGIGPVSCYLCPRFSRNNRSAFVPGSLFLQSDLFRIRHPVEEKTQHFVAGLRLATV